MLLFLRGNLAILTKSQVDIGLMSVSQWIVDSAAKFREPHGKTIYFQRSVPLCLSWAAVCDAVTLHVYGGSAVGGDGAYSKYRT